MPAAVSFSSFQLAIMKIGAFLKRKKEKSPGESHEQLLKGFLRRVGHTPKLLIDMIEVLREEDEEELPMVTHTSTSCSFMGPVRRTVKL